MRKWIFKILRICGYILGFSILLYPTFSNYLNQKNSTTIATDYEQEVSHISEQREEEMIERALDYNRKLIGNSELMDPFSEAAGEPEDEVYQNLLNIDDSGMMGYLQIPKINILLPIYHGISERVLQSGVGHLSATSLPVGGDSSHAVLSGHRGLPSAKLFTDLDKMELGDVFYIKVLHHTFAYQVDQILTVEPTDTQELSILEGKDYVTLVTCTPYAVNTHRLFVRGTRIPYEEAVKVDAPGKIRFELPLYVKALLGAVTALLIIYIMVKYIVGRRGGKEGKHGRE